MKKLFILTLLFTSYINSINSQNAYYIKDSVKYAGVKIIDQGFDLNHQSCAVERKGEMIYYSPAKVPEYKLKKGNRFISKVIEIEGREKHIFIEELVNGTVDLFYYKDKDNVWLVVEKNNQIYELSQDTYKETLREVLTDCESTKHFIKLAKFNKKSLVRLIASYENCNNVPMAYTKIGFNINYVGLNLQSSNSSSAVISDMINELGTNYSLGAGFFIDIPLAAKSFTFRPEINLTSFKVSTSRTYYFPHGTSGTASTIELYCNISSIKFPISFQYTLYSRGFRPFVNFGTVFNYNIKNECYYDEIRVLSNGDVVNNTTELDIIRKNQMGVFGGVGIDLPIFKTKELFIQSRYTVLLGEKGESFINEKYIEFSLGIKL